jgi:hypothetical protein
MSISESQLGVCLKETAGVAEEILVLLNSCTQKIPLTPKHRYRSYKPPRGRVSKILSVQFCEIEENQLGSLRRFISNMI